jgi:hypothetical protein
MLSSATATRDRAPGHRPPSEPRLGSNAGLAGSRALRVAGLPEGENDPTVAPNHLARLLHPSSRPEHLSEGELLHLVREICNQVPLERPTPGSSGGRRYVRLFRTEAVEAWVIAWASSAYLGLHDHGDSRGAYQVVSGQLREISADLIERGPLTTRRLRPGARRSVQPGHVHDLWNPTSEPALSVHVYSPPLRAMSFYSDDPATYLAKVRTETENEWPDPDRWAERAIG